MEEGHHLVEDPADGGRVVAVDGDLVTSDVDSRSGEGAFNPPQQGVALSHEVRHEVVAGDVDGDGGRLHCSDTG